ncbi:MAG: hypothetical protein GC151_11115 [Betaproteobacteria bacterium]|nr:hypothetical protein [Betaproteobacteria bacterium]
MERRRPRIAKLTRPRMHDAVPRERLFERLDAGAAQGAAFVTGPPGAGKTTLVSSWLDARGRPGIWFHVDAVDRDLPTFFYYLTTAATQLDPAGRRRLPLLTAEYAHDVLGFSRRYFRDFWLLMPDRGTLVLDNCHEVPGEAAFHEVLAIALEEMPDHAMLVMTGRQMPPAALARHRAHRRIALTGWEHLRFTDEEIRSVLAARGRAGDGDIEALRRATDGWAAGLTLMIEDVGASGTGRAEFALAGPEVTFEYFASQIFERAPERIRQFLMLTAHLPRVTIRGAEALTGEADAGTILDDLCRRHLFTHRTPDVIPCYTYHALFETFLKARARDTMEPGALDTLRTRAGAILESEGFTDDAFRLYESAGDWSAITRLVLEQAQALVAQGRGGTLREWVGAMPADTAYASPWVEYWVGMSLVPEDPGRAKGRLEEAYRRLNAGGDRRGALLAACGVIEAHYRGWGGFGDLPVWIAAIEECLDDPEPFGDAAASLRTCSTLVLAMTYAQPGHPMLPEFVARSLAMLDSDLDRNARLVAATYLLTHCTLGMKTDTGRRVIALMDAVLTSGDVAPVHHYWWCARIGYFCYMCAAYEQGFAALDRAEELAREHGLAAADRPMVVFLHYRLALATATNLVAEADRCLQRIRELAWRGRSTDTWAVSCATADHALAFGNTREALEWALKAVPEGRATGMVYMQARALAIAAEAAAECGLVDEMTAALSELREITAGTCLDYFVTSAALIEADGILLVRGDRTGYGYLREALALARRRGHRFHDHIHPRRLGRLVAHALLHGIEVAYAQSLVREFRLPVPAVRPEAWPWPVRIYVLGRFAIQVDGEPVAFQGKSPRKPLALLKAIVAFGGSDIPRTRLVDALWPDEEGDAGMKALAVALVRLRRILGRLDALTVAEQTISVNPDVCWIDVQAFEHGVQRALARQGDDDPDRFDALANEVADLYRGPLLPHDQEAAWSAAARARHARRFIAFVEKVARRCEACGQWDVAIAWYQRGIEADDLVEGFHQGLMRAYLALGRAADGLAAFRRLRQTLSIVLDVSPSAQSEHLANRLRDSVSAAAGVDTESSRRSV